MSKPIRIGGASGFWGEAGHATAQLVRDPGLDVLVYDFLAEITMSILARARLKDNAMGYAPDFVSACMAPNLDQIAARGIKVLSNAGGVNPEACATALRDRIAASGLSLRVAVVTGDDLMAQQDAFADQREMFSDAPFPLRDKIASINAYIGAQPMAAALAAGADIVITGRCVDSALTLAAAMHHFGWSPSDFDRMAAGSLAGHLLECGPQSTGGNFTDWTTGGDLARIGYPIAEIHADGTCEITKPDDTTGTVTPASVGEQMLYEIGDPRAYLLPDVACDFTHVTLEQTGPDRVRVAGARGHAPSGKLKVSVTWQDGYRTGYVLQFNGREARAKGRAYAQAGLDRARSRLQAMQAADYRDVSVECFGGRPGAGDYEEVSVKIAARHDDPRALSVLLQEVIGGALATPPGLHFFTGAGRPKPSPVVALFSMLVEASQLPLRVTLDGQDIAFDPLPVATALPARLAPVPPAPDIAPGTPMVSVPLERLAWARSGDKGDSANIGVIARRAEDLPLIWQALDTATIAGVFGDELQGDVERFYLPGIHAMNILMTEVLGGGGMASLRSDAQGKGFAQRLLAVPVAVPEGWINTNAEGAA